MDGMKSDNLLHYEMEELCDDHDKDLLKGHEVPGPVEDANLS